MIEKSWIRIIGRKRLFLLLISSALVITIVVSVVLAFSNTENVPENDEDIIDDCDIF